MRKKYIKFSQNTSLKLGADTIQATEGQEKKSLPTFNMLAYTGSIINQPWGKIIIDLSGFKVETPFPILFGHNYDLPIAHANTFKQDEKGFSAEGVMSGFGVVNNKADEVVGLSQNGFPWQASIGGEVLKLQRIKKGNTEIVNGQSVDSEVLIVREFGLREISVTPVGADKSTKTNIAATAENNEGDMDMDFKAWLAAKGFVEIELSESQLSALRLAFDAEVKAQADGKKAEPKQEPKTDDSVKNIRAEMALELRRANKIREICGSDFSEIAAEAIEKGTPEVEVENKVLKAKLNNRPNSFFIGSDKNPKNKVEKIKQLKAAAMLSCGIKEETIVKQFGAPVVEAAMPIRQIGLRELMAESIRADGGSVPSIFGDGQAYIEAASTTVSLPNILEDVMNKRMLQAYMSNPIWALKVGAVGSVKDFKTSKSHRLLGTGAWERVGNGGELKHGTLGETRFTNQAEMHGQIIMLTRKDIIDDDMGAFMQVPASMGLQAALAIDTEFFTKLLAATIFTAGNGNYRANVDSAFGFDALSLARAMFSRLKVGPDGKEKNKRNINVQIKYLLVPTTLQTAAERLIGSTGILNTSSLGDSNPFSNKFEVVSCAQLEDSFYPGYSAKAWYLLADPANIPVMETVFLNGVQTPTIAKVSAPSDQLGYGWAGYIDFGCNEQDPNGGVKMKGEA